MTSAEFVPYLSVNDAAAAVEFYSRVFETEPAHLLRMPDGRKVLGDRHQGETPGMDCVGIVTDPRGHDGPLVELAQDRFLVLGVADNGR